MNHSTDSTPRFHGRILTALGAVLLMAGTLLAGPAAQARPLPLPPVATITRATEGLPSTWTVNLTMRAARRHANVLLVSTRQTRGPADVGCSPATGCPTYTPLGTVFQFEAHGYCEVFHVIWSQGDGVTAGDESWIHVCLKKGKPGPGHLQPAGR